MSTFSSILLNVGVASIFCGAALVSFSMAVHFERNGISAPRTYARPKKVIKNVLKRPFSVRWISWALNLTYLEMLKGIEGTGTRNNGWSGRKLSVNLDGIVLLKYHSLCLKVCVFATVLCLTIVLPINYSAPCNPDLSGIATCANMTKLTDFENTTLAHIPIIESTTTEGLLFLGRSWRISPGLTMRLWVIVFVAYAIYCYTCKLIWEQWIENLSLRRAFYLEYNHYKARKDELAYLEDLEDPEDSIQKNRPAFLPHPELRDTVPNVSLYSVLYKLPCVHFATISSASSSEVQRQLQTAVDFFDKVVPNQPGYSSSVAAVTILPDVNQVSRAWKKWFYCANKLRRLRFIRKRQQQLQEGQERDVEIVFNAQSNSDPGSYHNPTTLQQSSPISDPGSYHNPTTLQQSSPISDESNSTTDSNNEMRQRRFFPRKTESPVVTVNKLETVNESATKHISSGDGDLLLYPVKSDVLLSMTRRSRSSDDDSLGSCHLRINDLKNADSIIRNNPSRQQSGQEENRLKKELFLASVDVAEESKLEMFFSENDIEQMTVYCREFARSSGCCCPYGCDEYAILHADAATLADLEQEAKEAVQDANEELLKARAEVNRRLPGQGGNAFPTSSDARASTRGVSEYDKHENHDIDTGISLSSQLAGLSEESIHFHSERSCNLSNRWEVADKLVSSERNVIHRTKRRNQHRLDNGHWPNPFYIWNNESSPDTGEVSKRPAFEVSSGIIDTDSYAVVTFTSRQAAIAARQCIADGCGLDRWREIDYIPIPPLADAPPWNICDCRGCCRPVTVTLPQEQKRWRGVFVVVVVVLFCLSYTIPLTYFSALVMPHRLEAVFPDIPQIGRLSGILSGGIRVLFFALCPQIFKALSNFGSGAASIQQAERRAIRYYWFFMLATAFTGTSLATIAYEGVIAELDVGGTLKDVLRSVANTVPTTVSAQWLNWIIFRTGIVMPFNYLLQFNNFLFSSVGFDCCARATTGGGLGGIAPFRIYVDCGVVFLCVVGLAPACPLIAPFAVLCYLFLIPMLRWLVIFTYRPQYDAGGYHWPLLHNIMISSMIWAQIVLAAMMGVKRAFGAAILAGLATIPTYTFHVVCKDRFLASYKDAGLLQTSDLDGWSVHETTSMGEREGMRRWLVDCHKAAYIPVCVNGEGNFLTAEPAAVIGTDRDKDDDSLAPFQMAPLIDSTDRSSNASPVSGGRQRASTYDSLQSWKSYGSGSQRGALFRRVLIQGFPHNVPPRERFFNPNEGRGRTVSGGSAVSFSPLNTVIDDEEDAYLEESLDKTV